MLAWSVACNDGGPSGRAFNGSILVGDTLRTFALYVPEAEQLGSAAPLILVFHGSGSSGAGMRSLTGRDSSSPIRTPRSATGQSGAAATMPIVWVSTTPDS